MEAVRTQVNSKLMGKCAMQWYIDWLSIRNLRIFWRSYQPNVKDQQFLLCLEGILI
jgi:hypothetical protein